MNFMNEHDIDDALQRTRDNRHENLHAAAVALCNLKDWTNSNSDGWAYWPKPVRAASRLIGLLENRHKAKDATDEELKWALTPVKSFLTRQGVPHASVFEG